MPVHKFTSDNGIPVVYTVGNADRSKVGIHLTGANTSGNDFANACDRAASQGFPCIYIHMDDVAGCA